MVVHASNPSRGGQSSVELDLVHIASSRPAKAAYGVCVFQGSSIWIQGTGNGEINSARAVKTHFLFNLILLLFFFLYRVSLCSPCCSELSVDQDGLKLRDPTAGFKDMYHHHLALFF